MNPIVSSLLNSLAIAQHQLALQPGNNFWAYMVQHLEQALHALGFCEDRAANKPEMTPGRPRPHSPWP
ncbi:MAG: hypothetical protein JOZ41_17800 [Chloroflexi bacterium]|nr:hypothetical protein [Chloroflexota bacterium]